MKASRTLLAGVAVAMLTPVLVRPSPRNHSLAQQNQPSEAIATGAISGVVTDGSSNEPVAGAVVQLIPARAARQVTDARGRFVFLDLPAGEYRVQASATGYLDGGYGREVGPADPLRTVRIARDEWLPNLRVKIWRPSSISGVVRDEAGEPIVGVFVRLITRFRLQGIDRLAAGPLTVTDDKGAYRIYGLPAGRYVVQVPSVQAAMPAGVAHRANPFNEIDAALDVDDTARLVIARFPLPPPPAGGRARAYPPAFHPAATSLADAATIELEYGSDRSNIDVALTPVSVSRVSGVVEAPPEALQFLTLRLLPSGLETLGQGAEVATALVGQDGRFTFLNVPAGSYTLDAPLRVSELVSTQRMFFPVPPGRTGWNRETNPIDSVPGLQFMSTDFRGGRGANYSGRTTVSVGASDVDGVVVGLRPNARMNGRVVVDAEARGALGEQAPPAFSVALDPIAGDAWLGTPRPTGGGRTDGAGGTFTIDGIGPGLYALRAPGNPAWLIKSIQWRGREYLDEPFDATTTSDFSDVVVTMTNVVPQLSGVVQGSAELPADRAIVIAFPVDQAKWRAFGLWPLRLKMSPVSSGGAYQFRTLPAGSYFIAAVSQAHSATWRDPEFLAQTARGASRVMLNWGAATAQNLDVLVIR
jgi:hypothetical protein